MTLRDEYRKRHPEFPWLAADDVDGVRAFLEARGWLEPGERMESCATAGEGNMNLTLRIRTNRRSFILKQARPWVEKYDHIPAPWDRTLFEQRFYTRASAIPAVSSRMPRLLHTAPDARVVILEDAGTGGDFADLYGGASMHDTVLHALGAYLAALHQHSHGPPDPELANREMRGLNHLHIFEVPLDPDNGLDLDAIEPGLRDAARSLIGDDAYREAVAMTGRRYQDDGPCLVHGDFFPGSWLRTESGVKVIDGEFCYYGHPEFDVGVALAHFALARRPMVDASVFLGTYNQSHAGLCEESWISRYAAVEVMRRLIGVAQLPLPPAGGHRVNLLERSRRAMLSSDWKELFAP